MTKKKKSRWVTKRKLRDIRRSKSEKVEKGVISKGSCRKRWKEREGLSNVRHNPVRFYLVRWILKDPRDYYFFSFLLIFIVLLLFLRRCERARTSDGAHVYQRTVTCMQKVVWYVACTHLHDTTKEREREIKRKYTKIWDKAKECQLLVTRTIQGHRWLWLGFGTEFHHDSHHAFKPTVTEVTLELQGHRSVLFQACSISFLAKL